MSGLPLPSSAWNRYVVARPELSPQATHTQILESYFRKPLTLLDPELRSLAREPDPELFWKGLLGYGRQGDDACETRIRVAVGELTDPRAWLAIGLAARAARFAGSFAGARFASRHQALREWVRAWQAETAEVMAMSGAAPRPIIGTMAFSKMDRLAGGVAKVLNPAAEFASSRAATSVRIRGEKYWLMKFETTLLPQLPGNWAVHDVVSAQSMTSETSGRFHFKFSTRGPSPLWEGKEERYEILLDPAGAEHLDLVQKIHGRWRRHPERRKLFVIPDRVPAAALPPVQAGETRLVESEPVPLLSPFGEKFYLFYPHEGFPLQHAAYGQIVYIRPERHELLLKMLDERWYGIHGDLHEFQYQGEMPFHEHDRVMLVRPVEGAAGKKINPLRHLPKPWFPFTLKALSGEEFYVRPVELRARKTDERFAALRSITSIQAPGALPYRQGLEVFLASFATFENSAQLLQWVRTGISVPELSFILSEDRVADMQLLRGGVATHSTERLFYLLPVKDIPDSRQQSGELWVTLPSRDRIPRSPKPGEAWHLFGDAAEPGEAWTIGRALQGVPIAPRFLSIDDPAVRARQFRLEYLGHGRVNLEVLGGSEAEFNLGMNYGVWVREGLHHWIRIPEGVSYELSSGQRLAIGSVFRRANGFDTSSALVFRLAEEARVLATER